MATTDFPRLEPTARAQAASSADASRPDDAGQRVTTAPAPDSAASPLARGTRLAVEASLRRHRLVTTRSR
jgi:hypothetical protein